MNFAAILIMGLIVYISIYEGGKNPPLSFDEKIQNIKKVKKSFYEVIELLGEQYFDGEITRTKYRELKKICVLNILEISKIEKDTIREELCKNKSK